jgi:hypothetical protein
MRRHIEKLALRRVPIFAGILAITAIGGSAAPASAQGIFTPEEIAAGRLILRYGPPIVQFADRYPQYFRPFPPLGPPRPLFNYSPPALPFQLRSALPTYPNFGPVPFRR